MKPLCARRARRRKKLNLLFLHFSLPPGQRQHRPFKRHPPLAHGRGGHVEAETAPRWNVVRVSDQLPPDSSYVSATGVAGVSNVFCSDTQSGLVSCDVTLATALAPNQDNAVEFALTATAPSTSGAITNYASVAADGTSPPPNPGPTCAGPGCGYATSIVSPAPTPPTPQPGDLKIMQAARIAGLIKAESNKLIDKMVAVLEAVKGKAR